MAIINAQHPTIERVYLSLDALSVWTFGMGKISALFFYRRIFCSAGARDAFHYITIVSIAVVAGWIVTFFVMTFNLCGHHSIDWDVAPGHSALCKLDYPYFEATTISDFLLDVFILTLPLPMVRVICLARKECLSRLTQNRFGLSTPPRAGKLPSRPSF